jgi:hypothetical protein
MLVLRQMGDSTLPVLADVHQQDGLAAPKALGQLRGTDLSRHLSVHHKLDSTIDGFSL